MVKFMIQKQSGIQLGVYAESGSDDHDAHAQALRRARALDARLAAYQVARDAVLADRERSAEGKSVALAQLATVEASRLAGDLDFVKSARLNVEMMKGTLLHGGPAPDAVATMRAIELRNRFAALPELSRMDELGNAIDRHSPRDLVFLRAILEDGDLMNPVPTLYRNRLTNVVMELSDPPAFQRMTRLAEQVDEFASAVASVQRYLGEDVHLSDRERARQADDERFRKGLVFIGGAAPDGGSSDP
jgi:hypothetical protein